MTTPAASPNANPALRRLALAAIALPAVALAHGCAAGWIGVAAAPTAAAAAHARDPGPSVALDNRSSTDIRVAYWVARVDVSSPTGLTPWRSDWANNLVLPAGKKDVRRVGSSPFDANTADSIVRVRIEPAPGEAVGPTVRPTQFAGLTTYWLELERPPPYRLRVFGDENQLTFESYAEGGLRTVPPDEQFPFRNESQPAPQSPYHEP